MTKESRRAENKMPLHWYSEGETPITIHRSSGDAVDATFVGVKAGSPSANHGQMDIGSFVLDADGVRWWHDLGAEGYHGIESRGMNLWDRGQDSDRWKIFRQSNAGHNTLLIDGQLQRAAAHGHVVDFSDRPEFPHTVVDMSPVYKGQAESVRRGIALLPSCEVLIQDEIKGKPGSRIRWGMITRSTPKKSGAGELLLRERNRKLTLRLLTMPEASWQVIDISKPQNEWDSPNRGTSIVAFETTIPESGSITLAVLATPGSCRKSGKGTELVVPLDSWKKQP